MDLLDLHRRTLDVATDLLGQLNDAHVALPTPCTEWDVRALVHHMIVGNWMAVALLAHEVPDLTTDPLAGRNAVDAYRESAEAATAAFGEPGALASQVLHPIAGTVGAEKYLGFRLADQAAHVWDLARACDLLANLPQDVCDAAVEITRQRFGDGPRPVGTMDAAQPTPVGASAADRMAAFLGRVV